MRLARSKLARLLPALDAMQPVDEAAPIAADEAAVTSIGEAAATHQVSDAFAKQPADEAGIS